MVLLFAWVVDIDQKQKENKGMFFEWMLEAPLSEPPELHRLFFLPLTSRFLQNSPEWFVENPTVRLFLFEEVITSYGL